MPSTKNRITPERRICFHNQLRQYPEHGGLLLSMDGIQPEKGNETLYVVREGFSGSIWAAQNLKSGSDEEL